MKEPLYNLYIYSSKEHKIVINVDFPDTPSFDQDLIGGLTATFIGFGGKGGVKTLNSIRLNQLKIVYASENNLIFILAVDPYFEDSAFNNSLSILMSCFFSSFDEEFFENNVASTTDVQLTIEMMFIFIFQKIEIKIVYDTQEYGTEMRESAEIKFREKLMDIFKSHDKFFKKVVNP